MHRLRRTSAGLSLLGSCAMTDRACAICREQGIPLRQCDVGIAYCPLILCDACQMMHEVAHEDDCGECGLIAEECRCPEDEAEAERTAEHARMTGAQHVAFYGLFYVRRSGWTKARQWIVWERAMALLNTAIAPGSALAAFPKAAGLLEPQAATSAARRDGIISESKS
jgi:hypothetical protein